MLTYFVQLWFLNIGFPTLLSCFAQAAFLTEIAAGPLSSDDSLADLPETVEMKNNLKSAAQKAVVRVMISMSK